jgi:hypothetical protein
MSMTKLEILCIIAGVASYTVAYLWVTVLDPDLRFPLAFKLWESLRLSGVSWG